MGVPKKKQTRSRSNKRRKSKKTSLPRLVKCPSCGEFKFPHTVCPHCGNYRVKSGPVK